jgi:hypothetical protein
MMLLLSLLLNIAVLLPVMLGIVRRATWANAAFGPWTPAQGILLAMYATIALLSAWLLYRPDVPAAMALLTVQIVYKLMSPFTVRSVRNPVVLSNLAIAAFHSVTLFGLLQTSG